MRSEKLVDQIEVYSNAIVGFVVAQSLAFSFFFGKEPSFRCVVVLEKVLALALSGHFVIGTVLAAWAIQYLSRSTRLLSAENHALLRTLYRAKWIVVVLFTLIPIFLLVYYGLYREPESMNCPADPNRASVASSSG